MRSQFKLKSQWQCKYCICYYKKYRVKLFDKLKLLEPGEESVATQMIKAQEIRTERLHLSLDATQSQSDDRVRGPLPSLRNSGTWPFPSHLSPRPAEWQASRPRHACAVNTGTLNLAGGVAGSCALRCCHSLYCACAHNHISDDTSLSFDNYTYFL